MNYIFVDDNADQKSSRQLDFFARENSSVIVLSGKNRSDYLCDEESHHWDGSLLLRFANYQNTILQYALDNGYDELFFLDSDLVLHPNLLIHLKNQMR